MNTIGDDLKFLKNVDRARAYKSSAQTVANTSWEAVALQSEDYDTNGLHSTSTNTSRLTSQTDGWYLVTGQVQWDQDGNGYRRLSIRKNDTSSDATSGTQWARQDIQPNGSDNTFVQIFSVVYLAVSDHVRMFAYQNSGGGLNINTGSGSTWFAMTWLGD